MPTPSFSLDESLGLVDGATTSVPIDYSGINSVSFGESSQPLPLPPGDTNNLSELPLIPDSGGLALKRLVSRTVPQDELPSVIETIVSNLKAADIVEQLRGNDTQTFVDIIDEACHRSIPSPRNWLIDTLSKPPFLLIRH